MLNWLAKRADVARKADNLYGAVVAQARQPSFYAGFGIPDTLEGRYEMIVLHLFLVLERLRQADDTNLSRVLIERFVTDMDDCMREIGVGDLTVPKRVKKAAAVLYKRADAYRDALEAGSDALEAAFQEMFRELPAETIRTRELSQYVRAAMEALNRQDLQQIIRDAPEFPVPGRFAAGKE